MQVVELKNLGVVSKFLGILFRYDDDNGWKLNQEPVVDEMLERFGLVESAAVRVPIGGDDEDEEGALLPSDGKGSPKRPTVQPFQSLVGSRPDVTFVVHRVTRRSHAPSEDDWLLAKKIAKFLKGTKKLDFMMKGDKDLMKDDGVVVEAFSDADYAADKSDRKSVSGGEFIEGGMIVGWMCKKQKCVALSTMEAEYVAASQTSAEMIGIVELLKEIGVQMQSCTTLHVDNQAAIAQIKGEDTSGRAKHIDVRYKFVKDLAKKD
uniref:Reverse transcriptase Ty1/copia-type domain-containing protein n=2 Tax=Peronospora matthiolae TaxID=2874970 RepID=A0AAV1UUA6_9STRA